MNGFHRRQIVPHQRRGIAQFAKNRTKHLKNVLRCAFVESQTRKLINRVLSPQQMCEIDAFGRCVETAAQTGVFSIQDPWMSTSLCNPRKTGRIIYTAKDERAPQGCNRDHKFLFRPLQHSVYTRQTTVQPSNHDCPPTPAVVFR